MLPALLFLVYASLVNDVRELIAKNDLAAAEAAARSYQAQSGKTSELAAAVSWLGRASLAAKQYDKAERFATEAWTISEPLLKARKLDADPWLPTAVVTWLVPAGLLACGGTLLAAARRGLHPAQAGGETEGQSPVPFVQTPGSAA